MTKEELIKRLESEPDSYRVCFRVDGLIKEYEIGSVETNETFQDIIIDLL